MKKKLTHNLGLKILALLFSFMLWLTVVNMEDPVLTEPYTRIPVEILNEDALLDQGKVYEILDNTGYVTVYVTANRSVFDDININNIHAYADLEELSIVDTVRITAVSDKLNDKIQNIKVSTEN